MRLRPSRPRSGPMSRVRVFRSRAHLLAPRAAALVDGSGLACRSAALRHHADTHRDPGCSRFDAVAAMVLRLRRRSSCWRAPASAGRHARERDLPIRERRPPRLGYAHARAVLVRSGRIDPRTSLIRPLSTLRNEESEQPDGDHEDDQRAAIHPVAHHPPALMLRLRIALAHPALRARSRQGHALKRIAAVPACPTASILHEHLRALAFVASFCRQTRSRQPQPPPWARATDHQQANHKDRRDPPRSTRGLPFRVAEGSWINPGLAALRARRSSTRTQVIAAVPARLPTRFRHASCYAACRSAPARNEIPEHHTAPTRCPARTTFP